MRKRIGLVVTIALCGALGIAALTAYGASGANENDLVADSMIGYFESPSVSSTARGSFQATTDGTSITYKLTYSQLEGTVTQAHIHFAQTSVNGGISAWLCETATNLSPNDSTPTCTQPSGTNVATITGTITAAEVQNTPAPSASQGIAAGEFSELIAAMRAGFTYANVHSSKFPGGELRGQIGQNHNDGQNGDGDDEEESDDD